MPLSPFSKSGGGARRASSSSSYTNFPTYDPYDKDLASGDIPLLPNRTFYDPPTSPNVPQSPNPSSPPGAKPSHRPSYLSLRSEDSGYVKSSDFDATLLYDPVKYNPDYNSTPMSDDQFLNTPSPSLFPYGIPQPQPRHPLPFAQNFEHPNWFRITRHIFLVALAYPVLLVFVVIARDKTLFWSRAIISIGCGGIGFILGLSLINLGQPYLEAATWATIIHQSRVSDAPGIRLRDLAATSSNPTSAFSALRLLWTRWMYPGTSSKHRKTYDSRPWTLAIAFFLTLVLTAASLPFILGRIVSISTNVSHQRISYYEVPVKGDLSSSDVARGGALSGIFNNFLVTWSLAPFSMHGSLPPAISYQWGNDMVYFSEAVSSQFMKNGSGFGTFLEDTTSPSLDTKDSSVNEVPTTTAVDPGSLLRYPRWGIRIHCEKLPNADINIVTESFNGFTYLFTPRDTLRSLFSSFDMDLPTAWEETLDTTTLLQLNDTLPEGMNVDDISLGALFYDNGVAHSMKSNPVTMGHEGFGWVSVESVLVRLNTTYAPNGTFPTYSNLSVPDVNGTATRIGFDAAVCLELYEPYILETYNSTVGLPTTIGIIGRNSSVINAPTLDGSKEKLLGKQLNNPDVKTQLNSTGLEEVYTVLHGNSVNQLIKDNGRDSFYVPSPTVVSYTGADGPYAYTELSPDYFAQARALADASNVLPYFAGSGDSLARKYPDLVIADTALESIYMVALVITVLGMGLIAGLFVPKLPYDVPHRGFEVYSWLAAFHGDELVGTYVGMNGLPKNLPLRQIEEKMGDLKFRYGFANGA